MAYHGPCMAIRIQCHHLGNLGFYEYLRDVRMQELSHCIRMGHANFIFSDPNKVSYCYLALVFSGNNILKRGVKYHAFHVI